MKMKMLLGVIIIAGFSAFAQDDCTNRFSIAHENMKAKNYDIAYPEIMDLRVKCPKTHVGIFVYAEKLLKDKLDEATDDAQKEVLVKDIIKLYEEKQQHYPYEISIGYKNGEVGKLMYENNMGSKEEQFNILYEGFKKDPENFKSLKSIYLVFSLKRDLFDEGKAPIQEVFNLYDEVIAKIEDEKGEMAETINALVAKEEEQGGLSSKEAKTLKVTERNLESYAKIESSVNGKLGQIADCENLLPLYKAEFEANKSNMEWLKMVAGRMNSKDCTTDPLFFKVVEQLHKNEPSANTALYLGRLAENNKEFNKAEKYYLESAELQTDKNGKYNVYMKLGMVYKDRAAYSKARSFFRKALEAKPSSGNPYLIIADMYAKSLNTCGGTPFERRAMYWLAAQYADKAARVDPSLSDRANKAAASYRASAPSKSDIFSNDMSGKTINFGCWVGESVKVPSV